MRFLSAIAILFILLPVAAGASHVSLLSALPKAERAYYAQIFDYSMAATPTGKSYDWHTNTGSKGSITLTDNPFISKSGATCRHFRESFSIFGHPGQDEGIGCKRAGKTGWCKLDKGSGALTCAMEEPMSGWDRMKSSW